MRFDIRMQVRRGAFTLEADIESEARLLALFGPSGAGKSTLLHAIAGLVRPRSGRIGVDGEILFDRDARVDTPTHRRRVGYVFQDGRLFPHLKVGANLRYGSRFARAAPRAPDVVALLGLEQLLDRWPSTLSGGERQRVAIGRALLGGPRVLLLDEPFASLDRARKAELLAHVERLRDELAIPMVLVSHDEVEVKRLADEVVVVENGRTGR
jgi:molybdate transport system ATP-binding protein